MKKNIEKLLFESGITMYAIHQATGIAQTTLSRFKRKESNIGNMSLDNAIKLNKYYLEEMGKMRVKDMVLDQTKEAMVNSMKRDHEVLKSINSNRPYYFDKVIPALETVELEELEGNWAYTNRLALSKDKKNDKLEIISHQVVWDEENEMYDYLNEKVVAIAELR